MELRHLRYFVAVAEEGSLTLAAERRLHTAQPSLSRQIRDLEQEIGTTLLLRSARGIELTQAGKVFLEHVRPVLAQVEAAGIAARRAGAPARPELAMGFLTGQEMDWMPEAMRILRHELPNIQVTIRSQYSPDLAAELASGRLDLAFMRREPAAPDLVFRTVAQERLVAVLPAGHRLAAAEAVSPQDVAGEIFITVSDTAPVLRRVIEEYLRRIAPTITPTHAVDNLAMAMSLVASTGGVAFLPAYSRNFLPPSLVSRPIRGPAPVIELVIGYHRENASPLLKLFLSRVDELIARVSARPIAAAQG